ncbi:MAG: PilN domain-containing protein, partial [Candidatus Omnitrophica bacterium]|nr:PilN domain-containing protein [Candidatus Omnitrophota bacterium]
SEIEGWQKKFVKAVKHSIYAYQNENEMANKEIDKIVITGAESILESLDRTVLEDKLGLDIEIISQFKDIPEDMDFLAQDNNNAVKNTSVAPLLGFALAPAEQKINLIPLQLRLEKGMRERGKDLYMCGIYLAVILITISSIFFGKAYTKKQYLTRLKEEASKVSEKVDKLSGMLEEIEGVRERIFKRDFALNFIYEIHKAIFPEIYLTLINFDGGDQVVLRGASSAMSEVFEFINALEKSECFQNVKTKFVTTRKIRNKDLTEFEIVCPIEADFKKESAEDK